MEVSAEHGKMEEGEAEYIQNVFRFGDLEVSDVMVHRTEMVTVNADDPPEEIVSAVLKAEFTRIPLWRDKPENIVGILHAKDLLRALKRAEGDLAQVDVMAIALPPWFVPDIRPLSEQLKAFRRRKTHFALVVDEYGEVKGLVTLEDILEEIVGDISDEHDIPVPGVRPQPDGSVNVDGVGADPRSQSRHGLEPAGRRGDHHRGSRHPRGALDPRRRPELHLPRLPLQRDAQAAQPHHGVADHPVGPQAGVAGAGKLRRSERPASCRVDFAGLAPIVIDKIKMGGRRDGVAPDFC